MADRALLIITHGEFGIEIIKSAEMIMGPQEDVLGLALRPGDSVEDLKAQAVDAVQRNAAKGLETIVLCDLLGGSPSNVGLFLLSQGVEHVITGLSLPMLIDMLSKYKIEDDTQTMLEAVKQNGIDGMKLIDINFIKRS